MAGWVEHYESVSDAVSAGPAGPALSRPLGYARWLALRGWFGLKVNRYRAGVGSIFVAHCSSQAVQLE